MLPQRRRRPTLVRPTLEPLEAKILLSASAPADVGNNGTTLQVNFETFGTVSTVGVVHDFDNSVPLPW